MKNGLFKMVSATTLAGLMFVGCGGGSSSGGSSTPTTLTGTFIDAQVKGLHYKTATQEGDTNENGEFKYLAGETIEFKLGNLSLGSVNADSLITPYTLAGDTDISNPSDKAVNIALLLQNFDADRTDGMLDVLKLKDMDLSTFSLTDTPLNNEGKISTKFADNNFVTTSGVLTPTLIDAQTAKTAMKNNVALSAIKYNKKFTQAYLDQVTLYIVENEDGYGNSVPSYILSKQFRNGIGYGDDSGTPGGGSGFENWGTYSIDENGVIKFTSSNGDGSYQLKINAVYTDYIEIYGSEDDGKTFSHVENWYTDKSKADAKLAQLQYENLATTKKFTQAYLDQVTLYEVKKDDGVVISHQFRNGKWLFDDTGSTLVNPTKQEGTYIIDANGALVITDQIDPSVFTGTITTVTADYIEITTSGAITGTVKFYTDKSKAQAELTGSTISFVSGKTIVMNDSEGDTTLKFNADGVYVESGYDSEAGANYSCTGKWKDLGSNKIGITCGEENGSITTVVPDGTVDNLESIIQFASSSLTVGGTATVTGTEGNTNVTIKSVSNISTSSSISVASGFTQAYLDQVTLYEVKKDNGIVISHQFRNGKWLFDDTGSTLVNPTKQEGTYTIDANGALVITDQIDPSVFTGTISTVTADYIEITTSGAITGTVKFYTDKSKAQTYLNSL